MGISDSPGQPVVAAIATCNRPDLLRTRSLPSLARQTLRPDAIVVVDDSSSACTEQNSAAVMGIRFPRAGGALIPNGRARSAAGAWNTALDWAAARFPSCWIAILDDDSWHPQHLELCAAAAGPGTDAVVSGIQLCKNGLLKPWSLPASLGWRDFLRGNPGWQGSNTFVRLSCLEEAGRFDEALTSTHDRDPAIRLLRLPGFKLVQTGCCTAT